MASTLAVNNVRKQLNIPNPDALPPGQELPPGHVKLFNNWRPSLPAGLFSIEVSQKVSGNGEGPIVIENALGKSDSAKGNNKTPGRQYFDVVAPQFSLDPNLINSYYPPDGHQDEGKILPHIVFEDPHVPWLRPAGTTGWMLHPPDGDPNFVPWLALMVFQADDLRVSGEEATALKLDKISAGKKAPTDPASAQTPADTMVYDPAKLPTSGAYRMTIQDYLNTLTMSSRVKYEHAADFDEFKNSTDMTSIIFPNATQLKSVFDGSSTETLKGLKAQKLLSHVRQLNTIGFPDAGASGHGFYSIVMSMMTGDLTTTKPITQIVHLVSIEHLDSTIGTISGRIGLVSLFSWTYQCIPEPMNFEILMQNLGNQSQPLRPPKLQMEELFQQGQGGTPQAVAIRNLHERLQAGYTVARWRAPSGEESVAFNRGPLVPISVPDVPGGSESPTSAWPALSMTGRDYLIFDKFMGMMDATYASAWSLGKLLAISDPTFNAALLRFRSSVWNTATSRLRIERNKIPPASSVLGAVGNSVATAKQLSNGTFQGQPKRINKPTSLDVAPAVDQPSMLDGLTQKIGGFVEELASVPGSAPKKDAKNTLYNGFLLHSAASSDWEIIYNWIYDVMFLSHIPAHVLFPEPSHLKSPIQHPVPDKQTRMQSEALRFFHIDHGWIDCFIDGALSCANHVEPQHDKIRLKIKQIFNDVLAQKIDAKLDNPPPVPRYGFVIRSAAVKCTPDLKLTVRCWKATQNANDKKKWDWKVDDNRDPLIRHTKLDEQTILSLIDCRPEELAYIEFAQPAHQQRFSFGVSVNWDPAFELAPHVDTIQLFTNPDKAPPKDGSGELAWKALPNQIPEDEQTGFYDQSSRCIDPIAICDKMVAHVLDWSKGSKPEYVFFEQSEGVSSSTIFGLEMNDRAYHFRITQDAPNSDTGPFAPLTRRIWAGSIEDPDDDESSEVPTSDDDADEPDPIVKVSNPPANTVPSLPATTPLNKTRSIPIPSSPVPAIPPPPGPAPRFRTVAAPWPPTPASQYELLVHPDYRPPPPKPDTANNQIVFSIADFLPTQTDFLYDLIFSIRRRNVKTDVKRTLKFLHIEIPVSLGSFDKDKKDLDPPNGRPPREPLLAAGEDAHGGVSMASNQRFVPSLFNGPASVFNDGRWDKQDVLLITITPRSGKEDGTMDLGEDAVSNTPIAVRLGNAVIAPCVNPAKVLNVYQKGDKGVERTKVNNRAVVPIRLTEIYANNASMQWSWCLAVKADQSDPAFDAIARGPPK